MVEAAGRCAAAREANSTSTAAAMKKKVMSKKKQSPEAAAESPSYRLALKSLLSCRNSSQRVGLGCSAPSICKQLNSQRERETACKRRASVSGGSEKKPLSELPVMVPKQQQLLQRGGSSSSSSSSFRAGMQLRRLSGCYECHMVADPISGRGGSSSMRATPCPDCGEIFVRQESLQLHQSIRHAVCELGGDDTSRNIIEIIFQSSWLKKQSPVCKIERILKVQSPVCKIERILKVQNTARTLARFEEYREAVKARAAKAAQAQAQAAQAQAQAAAPTTTTTSSSNNNKHPPPRCSADGNELLRFHCARLGCELGLNGATHLCSSSSCAACAIIRHGFHIVSNAGGVRTMATSGRAHDALLPLQEDDLLEQERRRSRAMLVCRVIAGRVKRWRLEEPSSAPASSAPTPEPSPERQDDQFDSVAASSAGVYSNLEELQVFNPAAILPCFVVVYKA